MALFLSTYSFFQDFWKFFGSLIKCHVVCFLELVGFLLVSFYIFYIPPFYVLLISIQLYLIRIPFIAELGEKLIGKGSFGKVYRVYYREGQQVVAVKKIELDYEKVGFYTNQFP